MNYRIASMLAEENATTPATKTIDVDLAKPISRITIKMRALNGNSDPVAHPVKMLSKVELVDGSNVLFALSGLEARALNYYERGFLPADLVTYANDTYCSALVEINFGRYLWDEQLAFDAKKFTNPQLRISHNLALGGSTPDAATLEVIAHAFDEKVPTPTGFLMSKEQLSYSFGAATKEKIDLATDLPYRFLILQSLAAGLAPWQLYHQIKLSEDNDARVVINDELTTALIGLLKDNPRIREYILTYDLGSAQLAYCTPTYLTALAAMALDSADATIFATQSYGGLLTLTGEASQLTQFLVEGLLPHGAMAIPFGKKDTIEDWYDVSKVGALNMTVTSGTGASGQTCQIVSQQYRKY